MASLGRIGRSSHEPFVTQSVASDGLEIAFPAFVDAN